MVQSLEFRRRPKSQSGEHSGPIRGRGGEGAPAVCDYLGGVVTSQDKSQVWPLSIGGWSGVQVKVSRTEEVKGSDRWSHASIPWGQWGFTEGHHKPLVKYFSVSWAANYTRR